jgi:dTDP-4-dehydrorhamnose 3,5-epimerase
MKFQETYLKDSYLIEINKQEDERGFFARLFCKKEFVKKGLNTKWVQINNSLCKKSGTLRGLHFQKSPFQEVKLIRCIKGTSWAVIVDLRKNSKTFGKWFGTELTEKNKLMIYVPKGFAHGYISLKPSSEILYLVSTYYAPEAEETLLWKDPEISINWPLKPKLISNKDRLGKKLIKLII